MGIRYTMPRKKYRREQYIGTDALTILRASDSPRRHSQSIGDESSCCCTKTAGSPWIGVGAGLRDSDLERRIINIMATVFVSILPVSAGGPFVAPAGALISHWTHA